MLTIVPESVAEVAISCPFPLTVRSLEVGEEAQKEDAGGVVCKLWGGDAGNKLVSNPICYVATACGLLYPFIISMGVL